MDWDDVRYFLALARLGSVRAAGSSLGVSHSTVARRIDALEVQLATRLFDRTPDGFLLTDAGSRMLGSAERIEQEMSALERGVVGQDERLAGPIHITCCDQFVSGMMMPALAKFCGEYPDIELCMTTDSRSYDLSKREADIAVRTLGANASPPEFLIGRKLVSVYIASYVSVEHAKKLDPECSKSTVRWISFEQRKYCEQMVAASSYPELQVWGSFASLGLLVQAAREGLGVAMLPCYVADRDPSLQRLAKSDPRHVADLWCLSHPDLRDNTRLQAARDCVSQALREQASLFQGLDGRKDVGQSSVCRGVSTT